MKTSNCLSGFSLTLSLFFFILISIFQMGCNAYKSPYPITKAGDAPLNQDIAGLWVHLSQPDETDTVNTPDRLLMLYKWDDYSFLGIDYSLEDYKDFIDEEEAFLNSWNIVLLGDLASPPYKIWNSIIDSSELINIQELGQDSQYLVFQYDFDRDSLELSYLSNKLKFKAESSEDFKSYIQDNRDTFYAYMELFRSYSRLEELSWKRINPIAFTRLLKKNYYFPPEDSISSDSMNKYSTMIFEKFVDADIDELMLDNTIEIRNLDSTVLDLNNFHLEFWDFEMDAKAEFFILESNDNYRIKLVKTKKHLLDASNMLSYKRKE